MTAGARPRSGTPLLRWPSPTSRRGRRDPRKRKLPADPFGQRRYHAGEPPPVWVKLQTRAAKHSFHVYRMARRE